MDSLQQRREEQILSLFESIEERELRRSAPGELAAPDQFAAPWEPTGLRVLEAAPAAPAAVSSPAPTPAWTTTSVTGTAPAVAATQPPGAVIVKRRRGRPPKNAALLNGQSSTPTPTALQLSKPVEEEEDVCFICFDGGSLVLCDRKGCPKAYHPACIKRDESFFQSRAKWMCGWHLCSNCEKGAYYMCYTCTYSLCKNCTKDADYVCVRGTKGLCGICMKTIMMIENISHGNQEMAQVDFDDKTSWEYLFKVYWVILKEKLSLTINELTQAKNPWIEPSFPAVPSGNLSYSNGDRRYGSSSSNGYQSARVLRGRTAKEPPKLNDKEAQSEQVNSIDERPSSHDAKWASEELLDFVAHMKNGDTSVLSQFDVQALLLEYIRKNNLRDTRRKCQIVCDSRLLSLFGKTTLGHFEMLKLLDSHFLVKENPKIDAFIRGSIVDPGSFQVHNSLNSDTQPALDGNKRRKTRKKVDERVPQVNPDDCAAADAHNISLIYLQKNLMEMLLDDPETFHDKIVGSVVRIKVSVSDQKQDIYRLARVVGTSKVAEPYNVGEKIAGVVLEIMNLDKQELMRIDEISDQEFSEDECEGLRQSIKCGKIKWHTVGELQQKALKLQEVRVNQWLEAELSRLNHLRDRASEKGLEKDLRDCVEKIQILNSPEERQRRMQEIPDVHSDQGLDPSHIPKDEPSALHQKIQDGPDKPTSGRGRKRRPVASAESNNHTPNKRKSTTRGSRQPAASDSESGLTHDLNKRSQFDPAVATVCALKSSATVSESASAVVSEVSPSPLSMGTDHSVNDGASHKMWHYQDPSGKTQGPFAMAQLRIWNASGHFPPDLRIWRIGETREDSMLLCEALIGNYIKQEPRVSDDRPINLNGSVDESPSQRDTSIAEGSPNLKEECPMSPGKVNDEVTDKVIEGLTSSEGRIITVAEVWDSLNDDAHLSLVQPQLCSPAQLPGNRSESPLQGTEGQESRQNSAGLSLFRMNEAVAGANHGHESNSKESAGDKQVGRLLGQKWKAPGPVITTDSSDKTIEATPQHKDIDVHDLPSAAAIHSSEGLENNAEGKKQSMPLNVPDQDPGRSWSSAPSLMAGSTRPKEVANEWGGGFSGPKPVDEWDSTLGSGSSMRPADIARSNAALTSANTQSTVAESSQTHHPLPIESSWQAIVNETNDFASLGEESVSDLLAEVEAMENAGLPSPTSAMKCGHDLNDDGKDDCFSPIEGFDPTPGPVKSEVFSSTVDLIVTSQPTVTTHVQQPNGASNGDLSDARRTSHRHSSSSTETERGGTHQNEGMTSNQWKSGSTSEHQRPSATQTAWQLPGPPANHWGGVVQGSSQWEGTNHGHTNVEWEARQGQYQRTGSFGSGTGSPGIWSNQQRYSSGSGRYNSPRDRSSQGADQGYSRSSRGPWSSTSNSNSRSYSSGGGYRQQPPKGQRVCKFYESGYCKRGASCSYFHP